MGIVAESTQMVISLLSIGKILWELLVVGIGLLAGFLTILFVVGILWDLVKDIIERIKK